MPTLTIPADARVTEPYWHRQGEAGRYTFDADAPFGLPFRPTPFYAQVTLGFPTLDGGSREEVIDGLPVQYRYQGDIFSGEKRSDLLVVPALSVRSRPMAIVPAASLRPAAVAPAAPAPAARARRSQEGRASGAPPAAAGAPPPTPTHRAKSASRSSTIARPPPRASVTLELPQGWTATPPEQPREVRRVRRVADACDFDVRPAPGTPAGEYHVRALVTSGGQDVRPRLSGDRVPAHPAAAHLRQRECDAEGDRRQDGCRISPSATSWASATRCRPPSSSWARRSS